MTVQQTITVRPVGKVLFKGCLTVIPRLPYAEEEAKMVGKKLRVEPLLGQQATKQAVLQAMISGPDTLCCSR